MMTVAEMTRAGQLMDAQLHASRILTERPHGSALVHLKALNEADAMLCSGSLHGPGIERFVVDVDIFEMLEVGLGALDMNVSLLPLFGGHNLSMYRGFLGSNLQEGWRPQDGGSQVVFTTSPPTIS